MRAISVALLPAAKPLNDIVELLDGAIANSQLAARSPLMCNLDFQPQHVGKAFFQGFDVGTATRGRAGLFERLLFRTLFGFSNVERLMNDFLGPALRIG